MPLSTTLHLYWFPFHPLISSSLKMSFTPCFGTFTFTPPRALLPVRSSPCTPSCPLLPEHSPVHSSLFQSSSWSGFCDAKGQFTRYFSETSLHAKCKSVPCYPPEPHTTLFPSTIFTIFNSTIAHYQYLSLSYILKLWELHVLIIAETQQKPSD